MRKYKISFCTVCMNRLHHIRQTLPKNIEDNLSYGDVEFVLFDYNSKDGLEEWVKTEMSEWIKKGLLTYYKTDVPEYFNRSHSRNVMFRLATGDIICNVDADNFTGLGFASFINTQFEKNPNIYLVSDTRKRYYYLRDALGRFCAWKNDFISVRGYDEDMSGYGFEDDDLYQRLKVLGREEAVILDLSFLKAIQHDNKERVSNEFYASNMKDVYLHYINERHSEVLFLYQDNSFETGEIFPNHLNTPSPVLIKNHQWIQGKWELHGTEFFMKSREREWVLSLQDNKNLFYGDKLFHNVSDQVFLNDIDYQLSIIKNMGKYLINQEKSHSDVNPDIFGKEKVRKDFSMDFIDVS